MNNSVRNVVIRTDASLEIGTGHIMRCLALAENLSRRGAHVSFICREHPGHLSDHVVSRGFDAIVLPKYYFQLKTKKNSKYVEGVPSYAHWLGTDWQKDAEDTIAVLKSLNPGLLLVDHFGIDAAWERRIKEVFPLKIAVIDGQLDRPHECDILIDPNFSIHGAEKWENFVPPQCKLFVGPEFIIFRTEFINARRTLKKRNGKVKKILIAFGGVDQNNATGMAMEAIKKLNRSDLVVDVAIGQGHPQKRKLQKMCQNLPTFSCHINSNNIAKLMADADLSIGAGGTMMWERCYLGLPAVLISIARNQENNCQALARENAAIYLGPLEKNNSDTIKKAISWALDNSSLLKRISAQSIAIMGADASAKLNGLYRALL